jgi:putative ABC transport system substrate-binding protein
MTAFLRRREFMTLLGGAASAWPLAARAQQPDKLPTIGLLGPSTAAAQSAWTAAFVQRLRELGWTEDRTVAIEYRWAEGRSERFREIAVEFVRLKVNIIITSGNAAVIAAKQATSDIPSSRRLRTQSKGALSRHWPDRERHRPVRPGNGLCR